MGLGADVILLATLTGVTTAGNAPNPLDLSGYSAGLICANMSAAGTTLTPVFQISDDGVTYVACPTGILATPAAITAQGQTFYPFLPANLALPGRCRIAWTSVTGTFTGTFRAYMRR